MVFQNRREAGRLLGEKVKKVGRVKKGERVVLGIPRGGVVVAAEVAKILKVPLDVLIVKKIGAPGNPELAVGAVGPEGMVVWNEKLMEQLGLRSEEMEEEIGRLRGEIERRNKTYRSDRTNRKWEGKTVIVVDDGIATGATAEAALLYLRLKVQGFKGVKGSRIVLAVPVIAADTVLKLQPLCDELVYLDAPKDFWAVGQFYREFEQTTDEEVVKILGEFK